MSVIELTTFTVAPGKTSGLVAARSGMLSLLRTGCRDFLGAKLVRISDNTWLDIVEWSDSEAYGESSTKGGNLPEIASFFDTIDQLASSEGRRRPVPCVGGDIRRLVCGHVRPQASNLQRIGLGVAVLRGVEQQLRPQRRAGRRLIPNLQRRRICCRCSERPLARCRHQPRADCGTHGRLSPRRVDGSPSSLG